MAATPRKGQPYPPLLWRIPPPAHRTPCDNSHGQLCSFLKEGMVKKSSKSLEPRAFILDPGVLTFPGPLILRLIGHDKDFVSPNLLPQPLCQVFIACQQASSEHNQVRLGVGTIKQRCSVFLSLSTLVPRPGTGYLMCPPTYLASTTRSARSDFLSTCDVIATALPYRSRIDINNHHCLPVAYG